MAEPQPEKTIASLFADYLGDDISRISYLNAISTPGSIFDTTKIRGIMSCEQPSRTQYLELEKQGYDVSPYLGDIKDSYDFCIIATGKFREKNETLIARAKNIVRSNGLIIVGGSKNTGIASAKKRIAKNHVIEESRNQHHAVAFSFRNEAAPNTLELSANTKNTIEGYFTSPGLFSARKIDMGSSMLVEYFPQRLKGSVADLGAGWGYLSAEAIKISKEISSIDLFESEWQGIEACRRNLMKHANQLAINYHWHDVPNEKIGAKFDTVIMNPPFHKGKNLSIELGRQFIETASKILKPKGSLLMVANNHLAYEKLLRAQFSRINTLQEKSGFKIIHGVK